MMRNEKTNVGKEVQMNKITNIMSAIKIQKPKQLVSTDINTSIDFQEARRIELLDQLNKKINIDEIKRNQTELLQDNHHAWKNSWRSWSLFKDVTREEHMTNLFEKIKNLTVSKIIDYLQYLNNEVTYANSHNSTIYLATIKKMQSSFMENFNKEASQLLKELLSTEAELSRLISKQDGHEVYNNKFENLAKQIRI